MPEWMIPIVALAVLGTLFGWMWFIARVLTSGTITRTEAFFYSFGFLGLVERVQVLQQRWDYWRYLKNRNDDEGPPKPP